MAVYYVMFNWFFFFFLCTEVMFPKSDLDSMALSSDMSSSRFPLPFWLSYQLSVLTNAKISSSEKRTRYTEGAALGLDVHEAGCFRERRTNNTTTFFLKKETRTKTKTHFSYDYVIFTRIYTSQSSKDFWNYEMSLTSRIKYKQ